MYHSDWIVLKFGGTSVSTKENWDIISDVAVARVKKNKKVLIVHSALSGISNLLEELLEKAILGEYEPLLKKIKDQHFNLAKDLGINANSILKNDFEELERMIKGINLLGDLSPKIHAKVMSFGELMATTLGVHYLSNKVKNKIKVAWLDARTILKSIHINNNGNDSYLYTACNCEPSKEIDIKLSKMGSIVITQGFIASNIKNETVLLGRGGSDTSASYFGAILRAETIEIWTDVPGMFTANPRLIPSARLLKKLDYEEAQEIASTGAKVLHPRSIAPAAENNIPVKIYSTFHPQLDGTVISGISPKGNRVKAVSIRKNVVLISMESIGMWQQVGFLADIFNCFKKHGVSVDLISTSESNVTVSLDLKMALLNETILNDLVNELGKYCKIKIIEECAAVSLVGRNVRSILHKLGAAFQVFEEEKVYMVSQASNNLNFTFVVKEDKAEKISIKLHEMLILNYIEDEVVGKSWEELFKDQIDTSKELDGKWWYKKREQLLNIANKNNSAYVYSKNAILENINILKTLKYIDKILFAMKANFNDEVLKTIENSELGFECVSINEINKILTLCPKINKDKILFTPNFARKQEYEEALKKEITVTIDNIFILRNWSTLFKHKNVFLRLDLGWGKGHHEHVKTGGAHSKFGISLSKLKEVKEICRKNNIKVIGLHTHAGSGILNDENWKNNAVKLAGITEEFTDVKIIDLGGGLGVVEKPGQLPLNFNNIDDGFAKIKEAYPHLEIWLEPGRFIVANAGVLLSRVTQIKSKGSINYIGIETGMNSLIRPALYGSYHEIENLSKIEDEKKIVANIVGPICESGDKLGVDRLMPVSEENDIMLVENAGAYGYVMGSQYNLRAPAKEVFIE